MLSFIKEHPFPVEAFFESSIVLTFAVSKDQLQKFIPECVKLDLFEDKWAFIAIAMVQTKALRPQGLPKIFGRDFFLIGYRIFVKYTNSSGKNFRGLYILKSETDQKSMEFFGNIFTRYSYTTTDIKKRINGDLIEINSKSSDFEVLLEDSEGEVNLPENSPFSDWREARRFAGPLPFTFEYEQKTKKVLIIEGVRQNWTPKPIKVLNYRFSFLDDLNLENIRLANTFIIKNVPYFWKKGRTEIWNR